MSVEVTTTQLFEQMGRLFMEARALAEQNMQLEQAVKLLRAELEKAREPQVTTNLTKGKSQSQTM